VRFLLEQGSITTCTCAQSPPQKKKLLTINTSLYPRRATRTPLKTWRPKYNHQKNFQGLLLAVKSLAFLCRNVWGQLFSTDFRRLVKPSSVFKWQLIPLNCVPSLLTYICRGCQVKSHTHMSWQTEADIILT
jgi:hypothetical protein